MRKTRLTFTAACKTFFITLAACALPLSFSACSDDNGEGDGQTGTETGEIDEEVGDFDTPAYAEYAAKYEVTDEESGYKSIELTESGNYVIVAKRGTISFSSRQQTEDASKQQTSGPTPFATRYLSTYAGEMHVGDIIYECLSGPYTKIDENTFFLERIGTVSIVHDGSINYTFVIMPVNDVFPRRLKSKLYEPLHNNTPKTISLCRTWDLANFRYYFIQDHKYLIDIEAPSYGELMHEVDLWREGREPGYEPDGTIESYEAGAPNRILFTKHGSYVVFYNSGRMNISSWAWVDVARGVIAYSRDNTFDGELDGNITVWFRGDKAYINETSGFNNGLSSFEEALEYTLQEVK